MNTEWGPGRIKSVDKENKTILLVNHDLNFAANYSDNIMIINHMRRISARML